MLGFLWPFELPSPVVPLYGSLLRMSLCGLGDGRILQSPELVGSGFGPGSMGFLWIHPSSTRLP